MPARHVVSSLAGRIALPLLLLIAALLPPTGSARAATFIPFSTLDFGLAGQRVEPGAVGVSASGDNVAVGPLPILADTSDVYQLSVSGADWRDRGNASPLGPLVQMGEDHIKRNSGTISLTLSDLPAGLYRATSYHIDSAFALTTEINIHVTDLLGTGVLQPVQGDAGPNGRTGTSYTPIEVNAAIMESSSATFTFLTDGVAPVVLSFTGVANGSPNAPQFPLSGLLLEQFVPPPVPEPSSGLLLAVGSAWVVRRRRARG